MDAHAPFRLQRTIKQHGLILSLARSLGHRGPAGLTQSRDFQRDLLGRDLGRRETQKPRLFLTVEVYLYDLVARPANGEGEAPVASAVTASDEGGTRLEPVHHALSHEIVEGAVDRGGMRNADVPHIVENSVSAHRLARLAQTPQNLALVW